MGTVALILYFSAIAWIIYKFGTRKQDGENTESNEFDLASVKEKFEIAKRTNDSLHSMEQLLTDLDTCDDERQIVIQISWLGEDDETHEEDIYCNGTNTATECMREIAEREAFDLRNALAYQCSALAFCTRRRKNNRQIDYEAIGEWLDEQAV